MRIRERTLREQLIRIPAIATVATLGFTGVSACTTEIPAPAATVTAPANAEQTPSVETTPAASPDASAPAAPVNETDITTSDIFNAMTTADQKIVQEATKLTFEEFVALDREVRAKAATVLADANVEYLTSALPLVDPGFTPEVSEELYRIGIEATPDAIKAAPTTPLIQGWNRDLTAIRMAATGNPSLLVHAKMIAAGSAFFTGPQDNHGVWDHKTNGFPEMISRLTIASASRKDTGELYPLSSTVTEHTSASDMSYAANLNYPDLDGKTLYNLRGTVITLADGTEMFVWQKYSSSKAGDPDYGGVMNDPDR